MAYEEPPSARNPNLLEPKVFFFLLLMGARIDDDDDDDAVKLMMMPRSRSCHNIHDGVNDAECDDDQDDG